MADFRALCAELVESVEVLLALRPAEARTLLKTEDRLARARAALADEPAVLTPPADGDVAKLAAWLRMQGDAQKPGPNSLLDAKTKEELRTNGARLTRAADLLERLQELENNG